MKLEFQYLSWDQFYQLCFQLFQELEKKQLKFDRIVCISRGGLVVARIFSDFLDLPISNFTVVSYAGIGQNSSPRVMEALNADIKDEQILLIDEIVDTGATLIKALAYLKKFNPAKINSLALAVKPQAEARPDFFALETLKWLIFPLVHPRRLPSWGRALFISKGYSF